MSQKANLINAAQIAHERALGISEVRRGRAHFSDSIALALETEDAIRTVEGTVFPDGTPRLLSTDGIYVETSLAGHLVYVTNEDVPGVIGRIGTILGENGINIADFSLGRGEIPGDGKAANAVAVVLTDQPLPASVLDQLYKMHAVTFAKAIDL